MDFAVVIKLRILIWEDYLDELNVITKVFVRERGRMSEAK